jgi:hypothetical protein
MPLEPKDAPLPFSFGIDNNVDEEGQSKGFNVLTNSVFDKDGAVVGRGGFVTTTDLDAATNMNTSVPGSLGPDVPQCFVQSGDALGVALENDTYAQATRVANIFPGQRVQQCEAIADVNNLHTLFGVVTLLEDETTSFPSTVSTSTYLIVVNNATGQIVAQTTLTSSAGSYYVKVLPLYTGNSTGSRWAVYYLKKNGANYDLTYLIATFSASGGLTTASTTTISASVASIGKLSPFDVDVDRSDYKNTFLAYNLVGNMKLEKRDYTGAQVLSFVSGITNFQDVWIYRSAWAAREKVHIFYWKDSTGVKLFGSTWDTASGATSSPLTIQGTAVANPGVVSAADFVSQGTLGANLNITWNEAGADMKFTSMAYNGTALTAPNSTLTLSNQLIVTRAVSMVVNHCSSATANTEFTVVGVISPTANQSGYKNIVAYGIPLAGTTGIPVSTTVYPQVLGQLTHEDGAPFKLDPITPQYDSLRFAFFQPAWSVASDTYSVPVLVNSETGPANQATSTLGQGVESQALIRRIRHLKLKLRGARTPTSTTVLGAQTFLAGSLVEVWDGLNFFPSAFLSAANVAPTLATPAGGTLTSGATYRYRVVFEYTDAHGNIQLSPPSPVASAVPSTPNLSVTVAVSMNTPWGKYVRTQGINFRVRVYRTIANGSDYFFLAGYSVDPNDFYGDSTISITDLGATSDTVLATAAALYTTSSVISSMAPMASFVWAHRNRLFAIAADQPETIYYTTETTDPYQARWNGALFIRVDNNGGPPLAGASLSDKIIILQEHQLCVSGGDGPNALGTSGAFSVPERFSAIGVSRDRLGTVCECRGSVFFTNKVSAYIVGPDLSVAPIGQALGGRTFWGSAVFNRARYLPSLDQLWLLGDTATGTYVYDFNLSRWSSFSGNWGSFIDVAERLGSVYCLPAVTDVSGNYRVVKYTPTVNYDTNLATGANAYVTQTIDLPWFRPGANGEDARLWRASVWARHDASTASSPGVSVATYISDERSSRSSSSAVSTFSWAGSIVQGMARSFLLKLRPNTPRCRAFRVVITITPTATTDDRIVVAGITYSYGISGPSGKQPAAKAPSAS